MSVRFSSLKAAGTAWVVVNLKAWPHIEETHPRFGVAAWTVKGEKCLKRDQ